MKFKKCSSKIVRSEGSQKWSSRIIFLTELNFFNIRRSHFNLTGSTIRGLGALSIVVSVSPVSRFLCLVFCWSLAPRSLGLVVWATPSHTMVWHGMAWHGMVRHGMAWHGMVWHAMARHGM